MHGPFPFLLLSIVQLAASRQGTEVLHPEVADKTARQAQAELQDTTGTIGDMPSQLGHLEGRLRISRALTWTQEAEAAGIGLSAIRQGLSAPKRQPLNARDAESWLAEIEARLEAAREANWNRNAPAAQKAAGQLRIELEKLAREAKRLGDAR